LTAYLVGQPGGSSSANGTVFLAAVHFARSFQSFHYGYRDSLAVHT
jgi:hypothetical protein